MFFEDKVTEIFCMADVFCNFFDAKIKKYTLPKTTKRNYHRDGTLSKEEVMLSLKKKSPYRLPSSSRTYCWASVQASVSLTVRR